MEIDKQIEEILERICGNIGPKQYFTLKKALVNFYQSQREDAVREFDINKIECCDERHLVYSSKSFYFCKNCRKAWKVKQVEALTEVSKVDKYCNFKYLSLQTGEKN